MAVTLANFNTQYSGIAVPVPGTVGDDLLRVNDVNPNFNMLNSDSTILYKLLNLFAREEDATQPQYWYFEDDLIEVKTTINGAVNDAVTTIVLDDALAVQGTVFAPATTTEKILVTAVTGVTCTVERGYQGSTAAAITDGVEIWMFPPVLEDGGAPKDGLYQLPDKLDNYVSFASTSLKSTELQEATEMLNGTGQLAPQYARATTLLMRQLDQLIRRSEKSLDASFAAGDGAAYHTAGLDALITTNSELSDTGLDWYEFNSEFNDTFLPTNSSAEKLLVLSQYGFDKVNNVCWDRWTSKPEFETTLGATIAKISLSGGGIIHVAADKYGFNSNNVGTQGYLLDLPNVGLKKMRGFDLAWRDVPRDETRSEKHELSDSVSVMMKHGGTLHRTITFA